MEDRKKKSEKISDSKKRRIEEAKRRDDLLLSPFHAPPFTTAHQKEVLHPKSTQVYNHLMSWRSLRRTPLRRHKWKTAPGC